MHKYPGTQRADPAGDWDGMAIWTMNARQLARPSEDRAAEQGDHRRGESDEHPRAAGPVDRGAVVDGALAASGVSRPVQASISVRRQRRSPSSSGTAIGKDSDAIRVVPTVMRRASTKAAS